MGWKAIYKDTFEIQQEYNEDGSHSGLGRPVEAGNEGKLAVVAEEDFGHKVAVDLNNGMVAIDYDSLGIQNNTIELANPKLMFNICEETNIVGELMHLKQELVYLRDEAGKKILGADGRYQRVRNDILTPLIWRPIWFTRYTMGIPAKVIGAQTTTPKMQGEKNVKKLIILFSDGRIGID